MSQRAIKQRVNKQIQLYRKQDTILETATIFDGTISSVLINPGSYTALTAMTITISDPPTKATPDTSTATASISTSAITSTFSITTAGTGYNVPPNISFSGGGGIGAAAVATLTTGTLTGITLTNGGSGYTSAPTIVIGLSSVGQETATGVVNVLTATSLSVTLTNHANGYYTSAPTVSFTGTGTSGVTGTTVLTNGKVTSVTIGGTAPVGLKIPTSVGSITIGSGGTGYTSAPVVVFTGGGGSGATATPVLIGGVVSSITLSNSLGTGLDYTSAPTISFSGGGGTGATTTCTIGGALTVSFAAPSAGTQTEFSNNRIINIISICIKSWMVLYYCTACVCNRWWWVRCFYYINH